MVANPCRFRNLQGIFFFLGAHETPVISASFGGFLSGSQAGFPVGPRWDAPSLQYRRYRPGPTLVRWFPLLTVPVYPLHQFV